MNESSSFIDELIADAERQDKKLEREHVDLILLEISNLNDQIENTFEQANRECEIIKGWALRRNSTALSKIEFLEKKLELYLRTEEIKTLNLPHGELKFRKLPNRIEITDMPTFLQSADPAYIDEIPSSLKPNLSKLRSYISKRGIIPPGCTQLEGEIKFSYSINKPEEINGKQTDVKTFGKFSPAA